MDDSNPVCVAHIKSRNSLYIVVVMKDLDFKLK